MLTGRKARGSTWLVLDEWIDQWSQTAEEPQEAVAPVAPTRRTTKKAATKKRPTAAGAATKKSTPARKKPATEAPPAAEGTADEGAEIGTNPTRRYGSASSRALGGH
jgi:polyhydroxyalkanoate synthase